jgi:hypothetical protein
MYCHITRATQGIDCGAAAAAARPPPAGAASLSLCLERANMLSVKIFLAVGCQGIDNGLGSTPPLGWRTYNAFGGNPTQSIMESAMEAMVQRTRTVQGKLTSLLDLGYNHVGLDGGWNHCFEENHTFHLGDGTPVWNRAAFPDPKAMVDKAHALGLSPGWYLNNCGCAENQFTGEMVEQVMRGSVRMLADQGWSSVKFDSCSQVHNLTRWAELINATGRPALIENCHQGALTPGMRQWQGYVKNATADAVPDGSADAAGYSHFLGMFFGLADATLLRNVSFYSCRARCNQLGTRCAGFTFAGDEAQPTSPLRECYIVAHAERNLMDMSNANHCTGDASPSDCPFNLYRVSGDIGPTWNSVLANLQHVLPFLGQGGVHEPYPQDAVVRSRPGGWAYPDMLEVGNLANATEDRSHFGAWAIVSAPLILSFDLTDVRRIERAWPIISNVDVLAVNQRWAGDPGRRISISADGWQSWAKRMGATSFAIFLINAGQQHIHASLPLRNASAATFPPTRAVCLRDLYTGKVLPVLPAAAPLETHLSAHDSAFYCAWPASGTQIGGRGVCDQQQDELSQCPGRSVLL